MSLFHIDALLKPSHRGLEQGVHDGQHLIQKLLQGEEVTGNIRCSLQEDLDIKKRKGQGLSGGRLRVAGKLVTRKVELWCSGKC